MRISAIPSEVMAIVGGLTDQVRYRTNLPAFNGQTGRAEIVDGILRKCGISAIVETGSYLGGTTLWLSRRHLPVYTVEAVPRFYYSTRLRLLARRTTRVARGDSRRLLHVLAHSSDFRGHHVFFYLDAHWYGDLPLRGELEIISTQFSNWVAMIDDFHIPNDESYGYDEYGPGRAIDLDYITAIPMPDTELFVPTLHGANETGAKRGCVVIGHAGARACLAEVPSLRILRADRIG